MPGADNITAKLIKDGSKELAELVKDLVVKIWEKEQMPEEFSVAVVCLIRMKNDKMDCNNYGGISLLNTAYKKHPLR